MDLAEAVCNVYVARLESVDRPGIHGTDTTIFMPAVEHALGQFSPRGHVLSCEGAADHRYVIVNRFPITLELQGVAMRAQISPGLFDRNLPHTSQDRIGYLGPAVGETVAFPFGS